MAQKRARVIFARMLSQPNWTHGQTDRQTDGQTNFRRTIKCGARSRSPPIIRTLAIHLSPQLWILQWPILLYSGSRVLLDVYRVTATESISINIYN